MAAPPVDPYRAVDVFDAFTALALTVCEDHTDHEWVKELKRKNQLLQNAKSASQLVGVSADKFLTVLYQNGSGMLEATGFPGGITLNEADFETNIRFLHDVTGRLLEKRPYETATGNITEMVGLMRMMNFFKNNLKRLADRARQLMEAQGMKRPDPNAKPAIEQFIDHCTAQQQPQQEAPADTSASALPSATASD